MGKKISHNKGGNMHWTWKFGRNGEKYVMMSFIICIIHEMSQVWPTQEKRDRKGNVARMGETWSMQNVSLVKPEDKKSFERTRRQRENNIKTGIGESLYWIFLANTAHGRGHVDTVMHFWDSQNSRTLLSKWTATWWFWISTGQKSQCLTS
jgi:hypothetical protein